ncbi:sensor histidine kinase [Streptomyces sp. RB6PN25]|uniref:histidine kinase n=1 Tax=Streptomyces humicola TaxID=2953240 RepID=A0ABT1PUY7_9ACTN|nr:sensor histidine kinase [Streptomyces humicola]MCQ4080345.1 sensor histidine kinase [Streptomyces humicola]
MRTTRTRQRLLAALLISVIAVLAAGAPGLAAAVGNLSESQRLLQLARLNTNAIALSHSLADERDAMAAFVAGGRSTASGLGLSENDRERVDGQAADVTQAAASLDTGGSSDLAGVAATVRSSLGGLEHLRQTALSGPGSAKDVFDSYTPLLNALDAVSGALARALPSRAASPDTSAGPALARAVSQASAERGLLVAALTAGGTEEPLVTDAQQARVGEQAALAEFAATASPSAQTQYAQTVTGSDVTAAEDYLTRLTAKPYLTSADNTLKTSDVEAGLSARLDRMRAVQASLAQDDTTRLSALRGSDVTALELRIALVALCALLALGIGVQTARAVTRPLATLQRYARDPQPPVPFTGSDEFAAVALAVERLAQDAARLRTEAVEQEEERVRLVGARNAAAGERDELRQRQAALVAEKDALAERISALQGAVHTTFVNLSLRTLALVERQLALIEGLEDREHDPEQLATLFKLDHLATRMRRNSESLLVLAGAETTAGALAKPVPLIDVVRAGISEIDRYERVQISFLPRAQLAGFAADDSSHLVAELLENATAFSPPQAEVRVSGWLLENGEVMLSVEDEGIGIPEARLAELNQLLGEAHPDESAATAGLGLYVVARLAGRHGIRVQLREQKQGGVAAVVVIPRTLVVRPPDDLAQGTDGASALVSAPVAAPLAAGVDLADPLDVTPQPVRQPTRHAAAAAAAAAAAEPDEHARPEHDDAPARPRHARPAADDVASEIAGVTGKGLPKRVPRTSGLSGEPAAREQAGAPVDAETLRRRLGGFARGLREGRRDAEAEATGTIELPRPVTDFDDQDSSSEEARG